ncbi:MAG: recombinase family protein [Sarcina sp.]
MKTAAIYARKSKATEKGDSIDNQIKLCKNYLSTLRITDYIIFKDDGFSGKNTDRPSFKSLMSEATLNKIDYIICYKLDRISRNVSDFSNLIATLETKNISFISVVEQFDTSSAMGKAMMYICSVFSQLERETISQRVTDNMYYLAENGYWLGGEPPTGFTNLRKSFIDASSKEKNYSILSPKETEISLVKLIFDKYLEFHSLSKLEKYMLSNNIKTKRNNDWAKATLSNILRNPCYVKADSETLNFFKAQNINCYGTPDNLHGILIYKKRKGRTGQNHPIENWIYSVSEHEGIIDSTSWLKVQYLLNKNSKKAPARGSSNTALLTGILCCSICKKPMRIAYGQLIKGTTKKRFYYMCTMKHNSGGTRCNNKNINGMELDRLILSKLKETNIDKKKLLNMIEKYLKTLPSSTKLNEISNIDKSIKQNSLMIDNLTTNISLTTDAQILNLLFDKIKVLNHENKELLIKKDILTKESVNTNLNTETYVNLITAFLDLHNNIDTLSFNHKKQLINASIKKIYVNGITGCIDLKLKNTLL